MAVGSRGMSKYTLVVVVLASALSGCTVHPRGESEERKVALEAGRAFTHREGAESSTPLSANPTADGFVRYALLSRADLGQKGLGRRPALQQISQDGKQA